ncbi:MAG: hypothetical protein AAF268_00495 [Cyanobacteria bacterium P01_A01_bin.3]
MVETGRRRWIAPHWFRSNSYFRIGWDWLKAAPMNGWRLIRRVAFRSRHDPQPALASLNQHHVRAYQLEFQILRPERAIFSSSA